jgi:hypothetical protein
MAIVEMTKQSVIEAIERERLTCGSWADAPWHHDDDEPVSKDCSFCAVGAVVRRAMAATAPFWNVHQTAADVGFTDPLMIGLSAVYEGAVNDGGAGLEAALEEGRQAAIAHVRASFPETIHVDIGDAKPRRGMRVVQS